MDKSRRGFFRQFSLNNAVKLIHKVHREFKEIEAEIAYFDSYEHCYPLISEYSYFLDDEIEDLKLDTTGKSQLEIVEAVYQQKGHKPDSSK